MYTDRLARGSNVSQRLRFTKPSSCSRTAHRKAHLDKILRANVYPAPSKHIIGAQHVHSPTTLPLPPGSDVFVSGGCSQDDGRICCISVSQSLFIEEPSHFKEQFQERVLIPAVLGITTSFRCFNVL